MKNYHDLLRTILAEGIRQSNRTGIDTLTLPGATLKFDLRDGFPAITTKKLAFNAVKGELIGFLRGYDNVKDFQALGCNVWNQNATADYWLNNPNYPNHTGVDGDLGRIYGKQWRNWNGTDISGARVVEVDQIARALDLVRNEPTNRRIVVSAWMWSPRDTVATTPSSGRGGNTMSAPRGWTQAGSAPVSTSRRAASASMPMPDGWTCMTANTACSCNPSRCIVATVRRRGPKGIGCRRRCPGGWCWSRHIPAMSWWPVRNCW